MLPLQNLNLNQTRWPLSTISLITRWFAAAGTSGGLSSQSKSERIGISSYQQRLHIQWSSHRQIHLVSNLVRDNSGGASLANYARKREQCDVEQVPVPAGIKGKDIKVDFSKKQLEVNRSVILSSVTHSG